MKNFLLLMSFLGLTTARAQAQDQADLAAVQTAVEQFVKLGDRQDANALDTLLHPEFRTVANRLFGAEAVSIMDKEAYLSLLRAGKIGGDVRTLTITQLDIVGNNATVKALMHGNALHFTTSLALVKSTAGSWTIIGDFPHVEKA